MWAIGQNGTIINMDRMESITITPREKYFEVRVFADESRYCTTGIFETRSEAEDYALSLIRKKK